jgi:hypothetical protein
MLTDLIDLNYSHVNCSDIAWDYDIREWAEAVRGGGRSTTVFFFVRIAGRFPK